MILPKNVTLLRIALLAATGVVHPAADVDANTGVNAEKSRLLRGVASTAVAAAAVQEELPHPAPLAAIEEGGEQGNGSAVDTFDATEVDLSSPEAGRKHEHERELGYVRGSGPQYRGYNYGRGYGGYNNYRQSTRSWGRSPYSRSGSRGSCGPYGRKGSPSPYSPSPYSLTPYSPTPYGYSRRGNRHGRHGHYGTQCSGSHHGSRYTGSRSGSGKGGRYYNNYNNYNNYGGSGLGGRNYAWP